MHKSTIKIIVLLALFCSILKSQSGLGELQGFVIDKNTKDFLSGAIISIDSKNTTVTNERGEFEIKLNEGSHILKCNLISFKTFTSEIKIKKNNKTILNIDLLDANTALDEVVISSGRYEQKLSDITVSMDVIKSSIIENKNATTLDVIINQLPGVTVSDGQVSIRGGSGFSYGAGSRVLMLVDEMPMISADAGDIKWNYLPLENLEQVEIIKGASSALYGSSALNGVINLRTLYAKDKAITNLITSYSSYDAPKNTFKWWKGSSQIQKTLTFSHSQKIKNLDIVLGLHLFADNGFKQFETEERKRFNSNLRYTFIKIPSLQIGLNTNMMNTSGGLFFLWQNYDSAFIPQNHIIQKYNNNRINIDPYIIFNKGANKFSLRNRYFKTLNTNDKNQGSAAELYYSELQYQTSFTNHLNLTSGLVYIEQQVLGDSIYGKHSSNNIAAYIQADKRLFEKITLSIGLRGEFYHMDTSQTRGFLLPEQQKIPLPFQPVSRVGLNYQFFEYSFLRASFGQGYRYPTIAEKFISTSVSALKIYPNPSLMPEFGYNAEIGIKQGFKISKFKGFIDLATFYTHYKNMIEFVFNIYKPGGATGIFYIDNSYAGFKSQNIGDAEITGIELSLNGAGKIGPINLTLFTGYTYINPINPNFNALKDTLGLPNINILKYRNKHIFKNDIQLDYKFISIGYSCRFQSKTENIDRRFVQSILHEYNDIPNGVNWDNIPSTYILPGLKENFNEFQKSTLIQDARISCIIKKYFKLSFIVNNFTNESYQTRPGDMRPPTQYVAQVAIKF